MGRYTKIHWIFFCVLIFIASRVIMLYQYNLAHDILIMEHKNFFVMMCNWDCKWYLTIIEHGYDLHARTHPKVWRGLANWAFFPLFPYMVKYLSLLFAISPLKVGIIINQIFVFISLLVFYLYLKLFFDENNSRFGVVLLAFSPFSVYFASLYTESLFLMLSLLCFYFMKSKRPVLSGIFGGLLSATRPVGITIVAPYLIYYLRKKINFWIILGLILSVSGLAVYMIYLHYHVGDAFAFLHIQKKWGRSGFHAETFAKQIVKMVSDGHNFLLFLFSIFISGYLFVKKYYEEALFNLCCILPGVMTGAMLSEGRFSGTLFTFYFGLVAMSKKSNSLKITLFVIFIVFNFSYFFYWVSKAKFLI